MGLPNEVLASMAEDITKAESWFAELKDVLSDMKLSGMDTAKQDAEVAELSKKLRSLKMFYELRKAKS